VSPSVHMHASFSASFSCCALCSLGARFCQPRAGDIPTEPARCLSALSVGGSTIVSGFRFPSSTDCWKMIQTEDRARTNRPVGLVGVLLRIRLSLARP
jgi:hypothetical protein